MLRRGAHQLQLRGDVRCKALEHLGSLLLGMAEGADDMPRVKHARWEIRSYLRGQLLLLLWEACVARGIDFG